MDSRANAAGLITQRLACHKDSLLRKCSDATPTRRATGQPIRCPHKLMASTKRKTISEYLADRIIKNQMRVRFSHAHADFLQEEAIMSQPTPTAEMNASGDSLKRNPVGTPSNAQKMRADATGNTYTVGSQVTVGPIKPTDSKTLEGSYAGDHRTQAADAVMPAQPGPRDATGQSGA